MQSSQSWCFTAFENVCFSTFDFFYFSANASVLRRIMIYLNIFLCCSISWWSILWLKRSNGHVLVYISLIRVQIDFSTIFASLPFVSNGNVYVGWLNLWVIWMLGTKSSVHWEFIYPVRPWVGEEHLYRHCICDILSCSLIFCWKYIVALSSTRN